MVPTFYSYVKDVNSWVDIWGLSPLLADAPNYPGVYHIVGANGEKYVGSSVNIAERLTTEHIKAAQIINSGNYTITYHRVDLGTAVEAREVNHILRAHEQTHPFPLSHNGIGISRPDRRCYRHGESLAKDTSSPRKSFAN